MKKVWVIGVILLFIGVGIFTSVSSKDITNSKGRISVDNIVSINYNEIEPLDNRKEIISYIEGDSYINFINGFIFWHIVFWNGELTIRAITINPLRPFYKVKVGYINAPRFLGILFPSPIDPLLFSVQGIAIGNIDW